MESIGPDCLRSGEGNMLILGQVIHAKKPEGDPLVNGLIMKQFSNVWFFIPRWAIYSIKE